MIDVAAGVIAAGQTLWRGLVLASLHNSSCFTCLKVSTTCRTAATCSRSRAQHLPADSRSVTSQWPGLAVHQCRYAKPTCWLSQWQRFCTHTSTLRACTPRASTRCSLQSGDAQASLPAGQPAAATRGSQAARSAAAQKRARAAARRYARQRTRVAGAILRPQGSAAAGQRKAAAAAAATTRAGCPFRPSCRRRCDQGCAGRAQESWARYAQSPTVTAVRAL